MNTKVYNKPLVNKLDKVWNKKSKEYLIHSRSVDRVANAMSVDWFGREIQPELKEMVATLSESNKRVLREYTELFYDELWDTIHRVWFCEEYYPGYAKLKDVVKDALINTRKRVGYIVLLDAQGKFVF